MERTDPQTARIQAQDLAAARLPGPGSRQAVKTGALALPAVLLALASSLAPVPAQAEARSRTERLAYHDDRALWVLGQTVQVTCVQAQPVDAACTETVVSATGYDNRAQPTTHHAFGKLQHTLGYHPDGTLASYKDGRNYVTTLSNWYRGVPRSIAWPDSTGVSATVNADGTLASVTDENGFRTCYAYDDMGRLSKVTYPSESQAGVCDTSAWNPTTQAFVQVNDPEYGIPAGHWRQTVQTGNGVKINYFDALWRPLLSHAYDAGDVAATQGFTRFAYDHAGRTTFASYPSTSSAPVTGIWTDYDPLGRATSVSQDSEQGLLTTLSEYLAGFRTRTTNPRQQQTTTAYLVYDEPTTDWPLSITHPAGAYTDIARDVHGKPLSLTRRNSTGSVALTRRYYYDGNQQLCRTAEPETDSTVLAYDAAGNLAWSVAGLNYPLATACYHTQAHASGRRVDRSYDARNRLLTLAFPDGVGNQVWSYTPDGLPETIETDNSAGGTRAINAYSYNRRRLPAGESVEQPGWYTWSIGYAYDANGHLAGQQYPSGLYIDYAPNALGQATRAGTYATGVSYHPNGAIAQFTYGNGVAYSMEQNARQLPLRTTSSGGVSSYEYGYDRNGNVGHIHDLVQGASHHRYLEYDGLDRLTSAGSPSFGGDHWHRFTYDALDNLRSWTLAGVDAAAEPIKDYAHYDYDASHRLSNIRNSQGATVVGLGYDVQGNLDNKNGQGYRFDYGNRLRGVTGKEAYRYDGLGRRVLAWEVASGQNILSMYSQSGQMAFQQNQRGTSRNLDYIYLQGSLVATRERNNTNGSFTTTYQHTDALGSPVAVTDAAGQVIERSEYEPYGKVIGGVPKDGPGYTGHVLDVATGLNYMQQRYYDPESGRFLSVDPVTAYDNGDMRFFNRYAYAHNNPYKFVDPDGRAGQVAAGGAIGGLIGGGLELYKQIKAGDGINVRAVVVETGRGAVIGMATSLAGPAGFAAAKAAQASTAAAVATEATAAGLAAGYTTMATGPVSDVLKGDPAQSLMSHGPEAAATMQGTVAGSLVGKAVAGALSKESGKSSVAVGAAARAADESTSIGVSRAVGPKAEQKPTEIGQRQQR